MVHRLRKLTTSLNASPGQEPVKSESPMTKMLTKVSKAKGNNRNWKLHEINGFHPNP